MSEIEYIVSDWINNNFYHLESAWDEAGGDEGGFQDVIEEIVCDVAGDVYGDLQYMVEDNLSMHRHYEIEGMIQDKIEEIEPEEED